MAYAVSTDPHASVDGVRYRLAGGVQVRAEKEGLLFYRKQGPRLYFLPSGTMLSPDFFHCESTQYPGARRKFDMLNPSLRTALGAALSQLAAKEVLVAY